MTREEQREIREIKKRIPAEIRKQRKKLDFQYAHGFLYRFEKDFLYSAIIDSNQTGILQTAIFIKPWILNEIYWKIQHMNMEEMLSQPKSFHVRGAFTINDIFFQTNSMPYNKDEFSDSIYNTLLQFDESIKNHKKRLIHIQSITQEIEGYKISALTRAVALMYLDKYEDALQVLLSTDNKKDTYTHIQLSRDKGISAKEYAIKFCREKLQKISDPD